MTNKKAKALIERLQGQNETFTITVTGDKENKDNAFYILMNLQAFSGTKRNTYHGIHKSTIKILESVDIKFVVKVRK